jgi:hypothetical protein
MTAAETICVCLNCGHELARRDVREIVLSDGYCHGPFCAVCAESAEGMPFQEWLDEMWQRQNAH